MTHTDTRTTFWFHGTEYTITSAPYKLYGGWFVDGVSADGQTATQPTEAQLAHDAEVKAAARDARAAAFRRLAS